MRQILSRTRRIDENLIRCSPTPAQEAAAIARRKAICEKLHPETKHGANKGPSAQFAHTGRESFSEATAQAKRKDASTVRRGAARGEALGDDLNDIAATSLDGVELSFWSVIFSNPLSCRKMTSDANRLHPGSNGKHYTRAMAKFFTEF